MLSFDTIWKNGKTKIFSYLAELLVVVFGVYLGFMANSYSEELKQKDYVRTTIKEMYQSLHEDIKDAESNKFGHERAAASARYFMRIANNQQVPQDSFEYYLLFNLTRSFLSVQNTSPFETIKGKGFNVIENDSLRKDMIKLYDFLFDFLEKLEEQYQESQIYANESNHINEILASSITYDANGKFVNVAIPLNISKKERNRLILILKRIIYTRNFNSSMYNLVIEHMVQLKSNIAKEYPFILDK